MNPNSVTRIGIFDDMNNVNMIGDKNIDRSISNLNLTETERKLAHIIDKESLTLDNLLNVFDALDVKGELVESVRIGQWLRETHDIDYFDCNYEEHIEAEKMIPKYDRVYSNSSDYLIHEIIKVMFKLSIMFYRNKNRLSSYDITMFNYMNDDVHNTINYMARQYIENRLMPHRGYNCTGSGYAHFVNKIDSTYYSMDDPLHIIFEQLSDLKLPDKIYHTISKETIDIVANLVNDTFILIAEGIISIDKLDNLYNETINDRIKENVTSCKIEDQEKFSKLINTIKFYTRMNIRSLNRIMRLQLNDTFLEYLAIDLNKDQFPIDMEEYLIASGYSGAEYRSLGDLNLHVKLEHFYLEYEYSGYSVYNNTIDTMKLFDNEESGNNLKDRDFSIDNVRVFFNKITNGLIGDIVTDLFLISSNSVITGDIMALLIYVVQDPSTRQSKNIKRFLEIGTNVLILTPFNNFSHTSNELLTLLNEKMLKNNQHKQEWKRIADCEKFDNIISHNFICSDKSYNSVTLLCSMHKHHNVPMDFIRKFPVPCERSYYNGKDLISMSSYVYSLLTRKIYNISSYPINKKTSILKKLYKYYLMGYDVNIDKLADGQEFNGRSLSLCTNGSRNKINLNMLYKMYMYSYNI